MQFNLPLDLAQYTYQLNPIYGNSNFYFYYFYAALNELDFDSAQRVAEHYRFWENSSPIQIRKTLEDHKNFQHWYQGQAHPLLEHSADDVAQLRPNLDMTYLTFSLLDANQPDLAQRWLDNSGETSRANGSQSHDSTLDWSVEATRLDANEPNCPKTHQ